EIPDRQWLPLRGIPDCASSPSGLRARKAATPENIAPLKKLMNDAVTQGGENVKALILYVGLVIAGAVLSTLLGLYLEHAFNSTVSLIVFLACFFANFGVSWLIVIYIMDGTLKADA